MTRSKKWGDFMNEARKVTWKDIFENFKIVYPNFSKRAKDFKPYNYMSIMIFMTDGTKVVYDDLMKRAKLVMA